MLFPNLCYLNKQEQIVYEDSEFCHIINGPGFACVPPCKKWFKRESVSISNQEYLKIINEVSGEIRLEKGPQKLFLGPNDIVEKKYEILSLRQNEYVRVYNENTGELRLEQGEKTFVMESFEKIDGEIEEGIYINECKHVLIRDIREGFVKLIEEPQFYVPKVYEEILEIRENINEKKLTVINSNTKNPKIKLLNENIELILKAS